MLALKALILFSLVSIEIRGFITSQNLNSFRFHRLQAENISKPSKGLNVLEKGPFGQQWLVSVAKWSWRFIFNRMILELAPQDKNGAYVRSGYNLRNGEIGDTQFEAEPGRYHVYVGNPCPWCHRVSLAHTLYQLKQDDVSISHAVDDPTKARRGGWVFGEPGTATADPVWGEKDLLGVYDRCTANEREGEKRDTGFIGRCTLPLLVDTKTETIVSNESKDIVRMLKVMAAGGVDLAPSSILETKAMSDLCDYIYEKVNNGVYRCGFSSKQGAYDEAVGDVFAGLDEVEAILAQQTFLMGDTVTEADVFLLPTAVRFDAIYHPFFKAGRTTLSASYPNIMRWMKDMVRIPGVRATFDLDDAKRSYYDQLFPLNPSGIVPATPEAPYHELLDSTQEDPNFAAISFVTQGKKMHNKNSQVPRNK